MIYIITLDIINCLVDHKIYIPTLTFEWYIYYSVIIFGLLFFFVTI